VPTWREFYKAASIETNPNYLEHLVHETERTMCVRLREVGKDGVYAEERSEIYTIMAELLDLKNRKLGWSYLGKPKLKPLV
jgi:hypothetical protein